ncbi:hypothetical protein FB566_2376 [Stackebrandtia endophytica]|uniref:Uncharacterized protein n=1 Tax=Stackebrandtia endophytica TaxID=1496996 RepID=A0A543AW73_9ACTN|nr:hypothetical protein [Stackebrandtia endophytica]TQL76835.1 hypothetical protein FB566_2376 [Stackebrandtia endophytica]
MYCDHCAPYDCECCDECGTTLDDCTMCLDCVEHDCICNFCPNADAEWCTCGLVNCPSIDHCLDCRQFIPYCTCR